GSRADQFSARTARHRPGTTGRDHASHGRRALTTTFTEPTGDAHARHCPARERHPQHPRGLHLLAVRVHGSAPFLLREAAYGHTLVFHGGPPGNRVAHRPVSDPENARAGRAPLPRRAARLHRRLALVDLSVSGPPRPAPFLSG